MSESNPLASLPTHAQKTIEEMQAKIAEQEQDILKKKRGVNVILDNYGLPPYYTDLETPSGGIGPIQRGQFYGQPLATAVRDILQRRKAGNQGPATIGEIYDALVEGGYLFDTKDPANAKRGLRQSLAKNTTTFHKLPTNHIGLKEWYPNVRNRPAVDSKPKTDPPINGEKEPEGADRDFDFENKESQAQEAKAG